MNLHVLEGLIMDFMDTENANWEVRTLSDNGSEREIVGLKVDRENKFVYITLGEIVFTTLETRHA